MDIGSSSSLLAAIICLALALSVILRPRRRAQTLYAILGFALAAFYLSEFFSAFAEKGGVWSRAGIVFGSGVPVAALAFYTEFLGVSAKSARRARLAASFGLLLGLVVGLSPLASSDLARTVIVVWVFGVLLVSLSLLVQRMASTESRIERARLAYLTIGAGLSILATALDFLPHYGLPMPPSGAIMSTLYMFLLAQTLQRLRLLDLNELLGKTVALSLEAVLFVGIYAVLVSWTQSLTLFLFNSLVATIVVLILFEPLRAKVEEWVVATMFRERFELIRTLSALKDRLQNVIEVRYLAKTILDTLNETRRVTHASLYLLADDRPGFYLLDFRGPAPASLLEAAQARALITVAMQGQKAVLLENVERRLVELKGLSEAPENKRGRDEIKRLTDLRQALKLMNAGITVPMMGGDRVVGFFNLWDERVPEAYASNEIALILELGERMATTVENSKLYERMKERDRLAALGEMAAGLAHEIRNPLGAIKGAAQYLGPQELPAETNEFLKVIVEEVNRLNTVVSQFLDYSRPLKQSFAPTDMSDVVNRTLKLLTNDIPPSIAVKLEVSDRLPKVQGDPEQLKQVLINLVQNAVQAMPQGGTLTLSTRCPDDTPAWRFADAPAGVEVRVKDTGGGIPDEMRAHMFVPFYTTKEKGTGLGLAICDRIVKNHGGGIVVTSKPGEGAEFLIRLPAIPEPKPELPAEGTPPPDTAPAPELDLTPYPGTLSPPDIAAGARKNRKRRRQGR